MTQKHVIYSLSEANGFLKTYDWSDIFSLKNIYILQMSQKSFQDNIQKDLRPEWLIFINKIAGSI